MDKNRVDTLRRLKITPMVSAFAVVSLVACSATPTQPTEVVAAVPTAVTILPTENSTPVSTETAIAVVVTAAGVSRFDTNGNVVSGDSAGEPIELPIQTFVYGKDVFSISNGKVEFDEQLNQYKWLEKIVGDVFNLSETKGSISVTDENGVTINGQVVEVYLIDDGSGSKYILPIVKMDDGKMKAIWSVNISTGEFGPMVVDQTSEGWRWAEGFDLQLEDWGEVVKEPELVGVVGFDRSGELANLPVITKEAPENPNYPLLRDANGVPVLGILAYHRGESVKYDSGNENKIELQAFAVGRVAGAVRVTDIFVDIAVDVPIYDQNGGVSYLRVIQEQYVDEDCSNPYANFGAAVFPLTQTYTEFGSPTLDRLPVQIEIDNNGIMEVKMTTNSCNMITNFVGNNNAVGAQFGVTLLDWFDNTKMDGKVSAQPFLEDLVSGKDLSLNEQIPFIINAGVIVPEEVGVEYVK